MKAVVVLSGGQDSALCLALAVRRFGADEVGAITFEYGQRHAIETRYARRLARHFGIAAHKTVRLGFYRTLTDSALLGARDPIVKKRGAKCPTTVVEGRNAVFLQLAAVWAKGQGAKFIYTGVSEQDFSGYPDCRAPFIRAQQRALRLALDFDVTIVTPFMRRTKADEWALADRLGLLAYIRENTVTCYQGIPGDGCGACPACKLRTRGLKEYLDSRG